MTNGSRIHEVRDPVHGFIEFTDWERDIINHPVFQRLRRIKQLAWTDLVYPGATHSRFEHSLGVMHLATRVFDQIRSKNQEILINDLGYSDGGLERERQKLRLAALLHDVGHPPFSHAGESEGVMPLKPPGEPYVHEEYSSAIIEQLLADVISDHQDNQTNYHITPVEIAELIRGGPGLGQSAVWRPVVTGQLDADRADYLLRDSIHTGVEYGRFDLNRFLVTLTLVRDPNDNPVIGIQEGGIHAAVGLIVARYMMFTQVYFHPVRRAYDHHIGRALAAAVRHAVGEEQATLPIPDSESPLREYLEWTDWKVFGMMLAGDCGEDGQIILDRSHDRAVYSTPEVPTPEYIHELHAITEDLGDQVTFVDSADRSWYKLGEEDILVREERRDRAVPLSSRSSVVRALEPIGQHRVYVRRRDQQRAEDRVRQLLAARSTTGRGETNEV